MDKPGDRPYSGKNQPLAFQPAFERVFFSNQLPIGPNALAVVVSTRANPEERVSNSEVLPCPLLVS